MVLVLEQVLVLVQVQQQLLLLSKFKKAADVYLQSDTFNEEYTALPMSESVAYWQGSGTDYSFDNISKIHVDIKDPSDGTKTIEVEFGGILGILFDYEAAGIDNEERTVSSHVNAAALFTNYFYHIHQILSLSPFKNAIRLTTAEV